jgi:hypothetical protein
MPQFDQGQAARKFQSFHTCDHRERYNPGYDTELPLDARTELLSSRRPPIPPLIDRPIPVAPKPRKRRAIYLALAVLCAVALLGPAFNAWHTSEPARDKAISQSPAPQPTLTPGPTVNPWRAQLATHPEQFSYANAAPRAVLVKLPPPKAQLVRVPEWKVGEERELLMPYGIKVTGRLKGQLAGEWMLPASGNAIGDTWAVGDNLWVWMVTPGAATASWIDP